ncbi:heme o synthase [Jannaschia aquimarina]|uniref:Protoheme IX farnesyltransferase n=1 Tax=Jannaschia aquimarina TaxID=935700 RepID=A0A0D1EA31_9RHOB|nr:heme o synthase [Jannaschia aquimarina]KIT14544.1 Protoheme IX farnesyltransferase [Jannaschia aquimarina]SNT35423.1 protoheme IX farnesyltransferase [Jannaschia aquimarina]
MTDLSLHSIPDSAVPETEPAFGDYVALLKPRLMSLCVFTAFVGLVVAPGAMHPVLAAVSILFIALGAGASGALNMWVDHDIDAVMKRTSGRPIPDGRVARDDALALGLGLSGISVVMLGLVANWVAAGLLAFTIFFYAVIYSIWLKRTTHWNTVVGGAAGALPPVIGWAAATGGLGWEAVAMFALLFAWQPTHFWALALFVKLDYHRAGIPMLTVTRGRDETRRQALLWAVLTVPASLFLALSPVGGPLTLAVALVLNAVWMQRAIVVWRRDDAASEADGHAAEKALFKWSLVYMLAHFAVLAVEAGLLSFGLGGW